MPAAASDLDTGIWRRDGGLCRASHVDRPARFHPAGAISQVGTSGPRPSFGLTAGLGWLVLAHAGLSAPALAWVAAVAGCGLVLGALWEFFEWAVGIIGTRRDTIVAIS